MENEEGLNVDQSAIRKQLLDSENNNKKNNNSNNSIIKAIITKSKHKLVNSSLVGR